MYVGFIAYCALTVVGTTDRQLVLNETARLPILNLEVSINGFFILAPLLAMGVFVYFQLYLQRINGLIRDLRTNYAPIEKRRLYPWMLNIAEDPEPGFVGSVQRFVAQLTLWWSLPVVLFLFALWVVKKHELLISYFVALLPLCGLAIVFAFWHYHENPGGGLGLDKAILKEQLSKNRALVVLGAGLLLAEIALLFVIIPFAKNFKPFCVNLSNQVLVEDPGTEYKSLYWLRLNGAHIEGADFRHSVLKRADLRDAHLQNADFRNAILDEADFTGADLGGADLRKASLERTILTASNLSMASFRGAKFKVADLQNANLRESDFQKTRLDSVKLNGADLHKADFRNARLKTCFIQGADLSGANFSNAFFSVVGTNEARLDSTNFTGAHIGLSYGAFALRNVEFNKTILKGADLNQQILEGAVFENVNLDSANLYVANLKNATFSQSTTLRGANLQYAKLAGSNLTVSQLSQVQTLYRAKFDSSLLVQIHKQNPDLLTKPPDR